MKITVYLKLVKSADFISNDLFSFNILVFTCVKNLAPALMVVRALC